jgi:Ca-activated chloride channel family protein
LAISAAVIGEISPMLLLPSVRRITTFDFDLESFRRLTALASPIPTAEIAKSYGIRVYTIGVGTNKVAPYPMPVAGGVQYVNIPVEIDTKTLSDIAQTTDGNFYRATNNNELKKIYRDIDKLEKTKFNVKHFAKRYEAYQPFALAALLVLLVEILLRITWFRRIP